MKPHQWAGCATTSIPRRRNPLNRRERPTSGCHGENRALSLFLLGTLGYPGLFYASAPRLSRARDMRASTVVYGRPPKPLTSTRLRALDSWPAECRQLSRLSHVKTRRSRTDPQTVICAAKKMRKARIIFATSIPNRSRFQRRNVRRKQRLSAWSSAIGRWPHRSLKTRHQPGTFADSNGDIGVFSRSSRSSAKSGQRLDHNSPQASRS